MLSHEQHELCDFRLFNQNVPKDGRDKFLMWMLGLSGRSILDKLLRPWSRHLVLLYVLRAVGCRSISHLRHDTAIRLVQGLEASSCNKLSIDIGGTLAKVALFQPKEGALSDEPLRLDLEAEVHRDCTLHDAEQLHLSVDAPELGGSFHFFVFETRLVPHIIDFVSRHLPHKRISLPATGGGAHKHAAACARAGLDLEMEDEMSAIVAGLDFLLRDFPNELFAVRERARQHAYALTCIQACPYQPNPLNPTRRPTAMTTGSGPKLPSHTRHLHRSTTDPPPCTPAAPRPTVPRPRFLLQLLISTSSNHIWLPQVNMDAMSDFNPLATPAACARVARNYASVIEPPEDYLYVSIGSGVSVLEIRHTRLRTAYTVPASFGTLPDASYPTSGPTTCFRRAGGSSVGGSTFWGLVRLLTSCSTFDEVIRLTDTGSSDNVDMLVGDIYGGHCSSVGLKSNVIAASFGKVSVQRDGRGPIGFIFLLRYLQSIIRHYEEGFWLLALAVINLAPGIRQLFSMLRITNFAENRAASVAMCGPFRAHDVALSLLRMVSNNIGHIATMCAQQAGLRHIVFGGSFIRDHPYTIATISSGVRFFSQGRVQPLFIQHDGFVGAIGARAVRLHRLPTKDGC